MQPLGTCITPLHVVHFVPLPKDGDYFQMSFFPKSSKIGTFVIPKLWMLIYFSNQICFENVKEISYSLQKNHSNDLQHAPIGAHLTTTFKGFVVGSQIPNLTPAPSFDHNSCKPSINEQCEITLSIEASRPCQNNVLGSQFGAYLPFQPRF